MNTPSFTKTYEGRVVLKIPELQWKPGTIYAILGANGAGKSTMIRILAKTEKPDSGRAPLRGVHIGYLPQKPFAFHMSTRRNVLLNSKRDDASKTQAEELLHGIQLEERERQNAKSLSGGETARMALCRVLMKDYDLLLLDEPTTAMDMESTLLAEQLIDEYRKRTGSTVLLITHSIAQARRIADEILYLDHGCLAAQGDAKTLLTAPDNFSLKSFLEFSEGM